MTYDPNCYINAAGTIFLNNKAVLQVGKDHKTGSRPVYLLGFDDSGNFGQQGKSLFDAQKLVNATDGHREILKRAGIEA